MIRNIAGVALCTMVLTGCSWLEDWPPSSSKGPDSSSVRIVQQDGSYVVEEGRAPAPPLAVPQAPDVSDEALTPVYQTSSSLPVEERLAMLEENVAYIQSAISAMQPSLERFAGLENSLQRLMDELEPAAGEHMVDYHEEADPAYNHNQPQTLPGSQKRENYIPASTAHAAPVTGYVRKVRIGEHPGKTRIVMDTSATLDFNIHNENQGHVLIIDLPATGWDAAPVMEALNSPLIEGYQTQADGNGGVRLFVTLRQNVRVLWAEALEPAGESGHRIVIDVAAS